MSPVTGLAAAATSGGVSDVGLKTAGAFIGGGLAVGLAATGAAQGDGAVGAAVIAGIARQPEAQGRLMNMFITTVGICESMYFINLAFMALFVFVLSQG